MREGEDNQRSWCRWYCFWCYWRCWCWCCCCEDDEEGDNDDEYANTDDVGAAVDVVAGVAAAADVAEDDDEEGDNDDDDTNTDDVGAAAAEDDAEEGYNDGDDANTDDVGAVTDDVGAVADVGAATADVAVVIVVMLTLLSNLPSHTVRHMWDSVECPVHSEVLTSTDTSFIQARLRILNPFPHLALHWPQGPQSPQSVIMTKQCYLKEEILHIKIYFILKTVNTKLVL